MRVFRSLFLLGSGLLGLFGGTACFWTPSALGPRVAMASSAVVDGPIALAPWWRSFADPTLDRYLEQALQENLEVREAAARIREAEAVARQRGALLFPSLDAEGTATALRDDGRRRHASGIGGLLAWEVDLWGRLRAGRDAAREEVLAARADEAGVRLLLSAAVAETYLSILEARQELALLRRQESTNQTLLDLTQFRFGQGEASIVDVLQQRQQLTATEALVPLAESALAASRHRLAVLLGRRPGDGPALTSSAFPALPAERTVSTARIPQRPDLRAQFHRIQALDHQVAEAMADRLPRLNLSASSVLTGGSDPGAMVSSAMAELTAPLFDAGGRREEVNRRAALLEEALHRYGQGYLEALEELWTALVREAKQEAHVALLRHELAVGERVLGETKNRYSQGLTDYLPVLAAVESVQELERSLIANERLVLSYRIQRYRALGGN